MTDNIEKSADHLVGAATALVRALDGEQLKWWLAASPPGRNAIARAALEEAVPLLATYYEDKGAEEREWLRTELTEERELVSELEASEEGLKAELAAAEDKGRSEERERLRKFCEQRISALDNERRQTQSQIFYDATTAEIHGYQEVLTILASLDSDQEAGNG